MRKQIEAMNDNEYHDHLASIDPDHAQEIAQEYLDKKAQQRERVWLSIALGSCFAVALYAILIG